MLENFQLAAIVNKGSQTCLQRIPLHQTLQCHLAESWQDQYAQFVEEVEEVEFYASYQTEEHEHFYLNNYSPPNWLADKDSQTASDMDEVTSNLDDEWVDSIKGIVGFAQNEQGEELVLFQNFTRSRVIRPGRFLFLENNTYKSIEHPGLTLDGKLCAIYKPAECKLLFSNFRAVNTFLPLADFYKEASEQEIRAILDHELLAPEDPKALASCANQWFRKRFAMLKDSGVLDKFSAKEIKSRSKGYDVSITIQKGKIVFPADKSASKKLLQFLNEELFRGAITETLYETNSKRQPDK